MDVSQIVDTALSLIDQVGIQALTLRILADTLDSGTATLYRHFKGKDELLALVADRIVGEVRITPERLSGLPWREAVTVAAEAFHDAVCLHYQAISLLTAQVPVGPNSLRAREQLIALFLSHEIPVGLAAPAFTAVGHYVIGFAVQQRGPGASSAEDQAHLRKYYRSLDPVAYPAINAAADDLASLPLREEFRFGLDLLLDGLEQARRKLSEAPDGASGD
ncbi:TetR/AcrR family transcriptional regulator [Streptomyces geranii]|uniref:TetR/AcrR family transcriptional regulator n=1 Tax=Streptomyces geranii TaxID=2058923 RepID=UPI000D048209|nr:TetR/AcrR family transcriptional regulator C-terminal domain-containing protein [Streptomyces geranii]